MLNPSRACVVLKRFIIRCKFNLSIHGSYDHEQRWKRRKKKNNMHLCSHSVKYCFFCRLCKTWIVLENYLFYITYSYFYYWCIQILEACKCEIWIILYIAWYQHVGRDAYMIKSRLEYYLLLPFCLLLKMNTEERNWTSKEMIKTKIYSDF